MLRFHWDCTNVKCMVGNVTEVEDVFVSDENEMILHFPRCKTCGKFRKGSSFFKIHNQKLVEQL